MAKQKEDCGLVVNARWQFIATRHVKRKTGIVFINKYAFHQAPRNIYDVRSIFQNPLTLISPLMLKMYSLWRMKILM